MKNIFSLKGKVVLLTGATGYLGAEMAKGFVFAGAEVLVNSRTEERALLLIEELRALGGRAEQAIFDVRSKESIVDYFQRRGQTSLHVLVNNAYAGGGGTIETSSDSDYAAAYEISLLSSHNLLTAALPSLRAAVGERGGASVINIGSMYGVVSPDLRLYDSPESSNPPFYGAAKAALIHWTRYAACEFGHEQIRVNAITPGPFPSKNVRSNHPDFVQRLESKSPMRRIGECDEIVGPAVFLASSASSYVNGANLVVDGGWTAW